LRHLTPQDTPFSLIPFIVIIKSIRLIIRSFTLSIRLTANIIVGHLLLSLLGSFGQSINRIIILNFIGQTKRKNVTRINEHIKNVGFVESKHSVITKHILELNHSFDWKNVKIMDLESHYYKKLISEMLYIKIQDNGLYSVEDIECLDSSYFNILRTIASKHKQ